LGGDDQERCGDRFEGTDPTMFVGPAEGGGGGGARGAPPRTRLSRRIARRDHARSRKLTGDDRGPGCNDAAGRGDKTIWKMQAGPTPDRGEAVQRGGRGVQTESAR